MAPRDERDEIEIYSQPPHEKLQYGHPLAVTRIGKNSGSLRRRARSSDFIVSLAKFRKGKRNEFLVGTGEEKVEKLELNVTKVAIG
jgi:hypothetical protein